MYKADILMGQQSKLSSLTFDKSHEKLTKYWVGIYDTVRKFGFSRRYFGFEFKLVIKIKFVWKID